MLFVVVDDNGHRFGHHCCRWTSLISIKDGGRHKLINFYLNLMNLLNCFDGGLGTNMHKAAHPSGGMSSSNPRHWRGKQLQHHVDGVC
jgi:hypothetical protein